MPPNTTATATVILVLQTGQVVVQANSVAGATNSAAVGINRMGAAAKRSAGIFSVMTKALISMFAVMIAWNLTITPIEAAWNAMTSGIAAALTAFEEFEAAALGMQAILASTMKFSENAGENFAISGEISIEIMKRLEQEAMRTSATFDQLTQGMQTFIGAGGFSMVGTWEEGIKLNTLLVTGILATTKGLGAAKQIATEIRAILTGTHLEGSQLAIALGLSKAELKGILAEARKQRNLYETLQKLMQGIDAATVKFGQTLTGIKSTITDIATRFGRSFIAPLVKFIGAEWVKFQEGWFNINEWINQIAAALGTVILFAFQSIFNVTKDIVSKNLPSMSVQILEMGIGVAGMVDDFKNLLTSLAPITSVIKFLVLTLFKALGGIVQMIPPIIEIANLALTTPGGVPPMEKTLPHLKRLWEALKGTAFSQEKAHELAQELGDAWDSERKYIDSAAETQRRRLEWAAKQAEIYKEITLSQTPRPDLLGGKPPTMPVEAVIDKEKENRRKRVLEWLQSLSEETLKAGDAIDKLNSEVTKDLHDLFELTKEFPEYVARGLELIRIRNLQRAQKWVDEMKEKMIKDAEQELKKRTAATLKVMQDQIDAYNKAAADFLRPFTMANKETRQLFKQVSDIIRLMRLARAGKVPGALMPAQGTINERAQELMWQMEHGKPGEGFGPQAKMEVQLGTMAARLKELKAAGQENTDIFKKLNTEYGEMQENLYELVDWQSRLKEEMRQQYLFTFNTSDAIADLLFHFAKLPGATMEAAEVMKSFTGIMVNMFVSIIAGEQSVGEALKGIAGQFIFMAGQMLTQIAMAALFTTVLGPWFAAFAGVSTPQALIALAVGTAMMGLGKRLQGGGGGGGGSAGAAAPGGGGGGHGEPGRVPTYVPQRDILVQQGMNKHMQANTEAINGLNGEVGRLSKEKGDVLVTRTIKENPKIVTKPVAQYAGRSYQTSKGLGGAVLGEA